MRHWTKIDHVAFLIAFVLSAINLFLVNREVGIV